MATRKKNVGTVAEICFYGTHQHGAGFLVRTQDGRFFGTGDLVKGRGFNSALWEGLAELRRNGITTGFVDCFAPCGALKASVDLSQCPAPYYGDLKWGAAPVINYFISAEEIQAAGVAAF